MRALEKHLKPNGRKTQIGIWTRILTPICLLVWGLWTEPSCDDESAWEAPKAKWKESSCWNMYQDCDPTGTMKRNLIMKLSRDANRPWEAPKAKWKEGSWWTMHHDCEPTGTMKRHLILKLSRDANRPFDVPKGKWNEGWCWNEDHVLVVRLAYWCKDPE